MLGLILAMLYVAFVVVTAGTAAPVAVAATMSFLWGWHMVFACVILGIMVIMLLLSVLGMIFGDSETKWMGVGWMFVGTPILLFLGGLNALLFLGGVYCIGESIALDPETGQAAAFGLWNTTMLVIGGILYGIGCLRQLSFRTSSSS